MKHSSIFSCFLSISMGTLLLSGCGGDTPPTGTNPDNEHSLKGTPISSSPLMLADSDRLETHLKNGIRLRLLTPLFSTPLNAEPFFIKKLSADSDKNLDLAKHDGQNWYVVNSPTIDTEYVFQGFHILNTDTQSLDIRLKKNHSFGDGYPTADSYIFPGPIRKIAGLYTVEQNSQTSHVAVIREAYTDDELEIFRGDDGQAFFHTVNQNNMTLHLINGITQIAVFNAEQAADSGPEWAVDIEGKLIQSRQDNDILHVVTHHNAWYHDLKILLGNGEDPAPINEATLNSVSLQDILPYYTINNDRNLLTDNCYIPSNTQHDHGFLSLIHVTSIDLKNQNIIKSTCINAPINTLNMGESALYAASPFSNETGSHTVIHKFSLNETGSQYEASGNIPGTLEYSYLSHLRLNEHQNQLRVFTTNDDRQETLFILEQNGDQLNTIASLPNDARPTVFNTGAERITDILFNQDRIYLTTRGPKEPSFILDLSDVNDPKIARDIQHPDSLDRYAYYSLPVGEGFLFNIGYSITGIVLEAELLDIRTDTAKVIQYLSFEESGLLADVISDHRAISVLPVGDDEIRIAFPIHKHPSYIANEVDIQLLTITSIRNNNPTLAKFGLLTANILDAQSPRMGINHINRVVLKEDAIFYSFKGLFWSAPWGSTSQFGMPYRPE